MANLEVDCFMLVVDTYVWCRKVNITATPTYSKIHLKEKNKESTIRLSLIKAQILPQETRDVALREVVALTYLFNSMGRVSDGNETDG